MSLAFVNIHGDPVDTTKRVKLPKRESATSGQFHKGWRVIGVSPEAVVQAAAAHEERNKKQGLDDKFDPEKWIKNATLKPTRTKPFEIEESAILCAKLARSSGWQRVEIQRLAKGA